MIYLKTFSYKNCLKTIRAALLVVFFSYLSLTSLKAQTDSCPVPDPCPGVAWNTETNRHYGAGYNYYWSYQWRYCNNTYQLRNFHYTYETFGGLFNKKTYEEEDFNGLKEMAEFESVYSVIRYRIGLGNVPTCPDSIAFASVYTASCGVWLRCSYEFGCVNPPYAPTVTIHQDGVPPSTYTCPSPYIYNQHPTIDVWHYESCGDVCCEKTYAICVQHNAVDNIDEIVIKNVDRHKLSGSSCTKNNQFHKWEAPGTVVIPCEDGCQGDGNKY